MRHETIPPLVEGLMRARSYVDGGWCQGSLSVIADDGQRFCAIGALTKAFDILEDEYIRAVTHLERAVAFTHPPFSVIGFNDRPDTTKADILAMFDRAIQSALNETASAC